MLYMFNICVLSHRVTTGMEVVQISFFITVALLQMHNVTGNCLDTFSCDDCFPCDPVIDVQLSSKIYEISSSTSCVLPNHTKCGVLNHTSVTITGAPDGGTMLKCNDGLNIIFNNSQTVTISNITLLNCGGKINEVINSTLTRATSNFYFGKGSKYALMFLYSINITLNNVMMLDSPGYSLIALNALGTVELSNITISNSTSSLDIDSGSGVAFLYTDQSTNNSTLKVCSSRFFNNTAIIPKDIYESYLRQLNLGYTDENIPVLGAASVTIYYLHSNYNVNTIISDVEFINNNGTFSGSVAIIQTHNTKSRTQFNNCVFNNSKGVRDFSNSDVIRVGGIYYINYQLNSNVNPSDNKGEEFKVLTAVNCIFENLEGKLGGAFHIEKNSLDSVHVIVKIEHCSFRYNSADTGSALYAKDRSTKLPYKPSLGGSLTIHAINIGAEDNGLPSGSSIQGATSNFITGVFYIFNCLVTLQCTEQCKFSNNKPSVFYAYGSALTMSGNIKFLNNKARFGGAIKLIDTVTYINVNSSIYFRGNNVTGNGGAIEVEVPLTNIQSQDYCPFQFVGPPVDGPVTDHNLNDFKTKTNINVTFEANHAGVEINDSSEQSDTTVTDPADLIERIESIYANVFYVCSWFPGTSVQTTIGPDTTVENGARIAVYHKTFTYGNPNLAEKHLNILAILPCICNKSGNYGDYVSYCLNGTTIDMSPQLNVTPGRTFTLNVTSINTVGSVGHSSKLVSRAYIYDKNSNTSDDFFDLDDYLLQRENNDNQCIEVQFTVFVHNNETELKSKTGILSLSVAAPRVTNVSFSFTNCPRGYEIGEVDNSAPTQFACLCKPFITQLKGFNCDANFGEITRSDKQAWLGVINGDIQYMKPCSPTLCNDRTTVVDLSDNDNGNLCVQNHKGRGCGTCKDSFGRQFGSDACRKCSNYWLFTILLYALLGVILVVVLFALKFTVKIGLINGLIFFCNVMSINEQLFFNKNINRASLFSENITSSSFLRVFISLFNLDLGFEICFYREMSQVAKTGLQFLFPVYLWPLIVVIVYLSRYSHRFQGRVSHSAVSVFATLILLSYAKLLRTAISVFSFADVESVDSTTLRVWRPDPSVFYWHDGHAVLFVIATLFLLFIFPFAISFTYPRILLYKKFSYFIPLFDCFTGPYKSKYQYWFGVRAAILIYLALMETVIFDDKEALLLSNLVVVGTFAMVQAYIHPYKSTLVNCSDLTFTAIFLLLSSTVLYIHPTANDPDSKGFDGVNVAVSVFGYISFFFFCLMVAYHIHEASKKSYWYISTVEKFWNKVKTYKDNRIVNMVISSAAITKNASLNRYHQLDNINVPEEERFQDSYYEQM